MLFERLAIAWLKEATPAAVARRLGLTWEEANGIVERAVRRGLARRPSMAGRYLGIDEHSYLKHFQFVTMVVNLEERTVLHVADDRTADTLAGYFEALSIEDRLAIEAIAMDMWDPYRKTVRDYVPDGDSKIVFDRFHVMRHVIEAMDQVRRRENRVLRQRGDKRLTGTKFLWLKTHVGGSDFTAASRRQFRRAAQEHSEVRTGVGDEGCVPPPLGLSLDPGGARLLRALAGLGDPLSPQTDDPRRRHHPPASREHSELPQPPDHQRGDRGTQREDPVDQVLLARLPRPGTVQGGDLLPLRRLGPRPAMMRTL